jgi:hypothetical protein
VLPVCIAPAAAAPPTGPCTRSLLPPLTAAFPIKKSAVLDGPPRDSG